MLFVCVYVHVLHLKRKGVTQLCWIEQLQSDLVTHAVTDTSHIWSRLHNSNARQAGKLKILLSTVEYVQCLQWQNRPTYRVLICSDPAQIPKLFSAALCTFNKVFPPAACFLDTYPSYLCQHAHHNMLTIASLQWHVKAHAFVCHISVDTHARSPLTHTGKHPLAPEFRLL